MPEIWWKLSFSQNCSPLVLIQIYAVIKFCELWCIVYVIVSADLWLKKQASKDFVLLLPTGMCIS